MDIATVATSIASSLGISTATAAWLSHTLIGHRLQKDLEEHKSALQREIEMQKGKLATQLEEYRDLLNRGRDELQASLRGRVETALGEQAADREYRLEARKRLYQVVGPLRFQLLLACRDLSERIIRHGANANPYSTRLDGYYGRSTLYRILRPIAISALIERQIAYADFAVDPAALQVLRFRAGAFLAWTDGGILLDYPRVNWDVQEQHVFSDNLRRASNVLIKREDSGLHRVLDYQEFEELLLDKETFRILHPFPRLLDNFSINERPILWLRLVCAGYLCSRFVSLEGRDIGFEDRSFPVQELLEKCQDAHVQAHLGAYEAAFGKVATVSL